MLCLEQMLIKEMKMNQISIVAGQKTKKELKDGKTPNESKDNYL